MYAGTEVPGNDKTVILLTLCMDGVPSNGKTMLTVCMDGVPGNGKLCVWMEHQVMGKRG